MTARTASPCLVCCLFCLLPLAAASLKREPAADSLTHSAVRHLLSSPEVDVPLQGACASDILYHCAHILTERQKQVVHGKKAGGGSALQEALLQAADAAEDVAVTGQAAAGAGGATDLTYGDSGVGTGGGGSVGPRAHTAAPLSLADADTEPAGVAAAEEEEEAAEEEDREADKSSDTVPYDPTDPTVAADGSSGQGATAVASAAIGAAAASAVAADRAVNPGTGAVAGGASGAAAATTAAAAAGGRLADTLKLPADSKVVGGAATAGAGGTDGAYVDSDGDDVFGTGDDAAAYGAVEGGEGLAEAEGVSGAAAEAAQRVGLSVVGKGVSGTAAVRGTAGTGLLPQGMELEDGEGGPEEDEIFVTGLEKAQDAQLGASAATTPRIRAWRTGSGNEAAQLVEQQSALPAVLRRLGLDDAPVRDLAAANAPVARCLRQAIHTGLLSLSPDAPHVGAECKMDVRDFFVRRATDIRLDLPLLASCAQDIEARCASVTAPGKVLGCLKAAKTELHSVCRAAVVAHQIESSEDISLDPDLGAACAADRERLCSEAGWGEGAAQACLLSYVHGTTGFPGGSSDGGSDSVGGEGRSAVVAASSGADTSAGGNGFGGLSAVCDAALFQRQMEESEDIRFSYELATACSADKQLLCRDVRPGRAGVLACLERHLAQDPDKMDGACRSAMQGQQRLHAQDARLDYHFRTHCGGDVRALCADDDAALLLPPTAARPAAPRGAGGALLECVRAAQPRIRNAECKRYIFAVSMAMYHDNTLDGRLQAVCANDMGRCRNPGAAITCLKDSIRKYGDVSEPCRELVTVRLVEAASDLAFNPRLLDACAAERLQFCSAGFLQGSAVIDCLADNRKDAAFGEECREALLEHLQEAVSDIRMMHSLRSQCKQDMTLLCADVAPGEGRVIRCLQQNRGLVQSQGCRTQILRLLGFVVEDARLDFRLMTECRSDAQQFCAGVRAGGGLLHECLRESWDHLSAGCKRAEAEVETLEHEDVRLNPRLQKSCPHARSMFCSVVPPGDSGVISCLLSHLSAPHFPEQCKAVLTRLLDRSSTRYSLNPRLRRACQGDAAKLCVGAVEDPDTMGVQDSTLGCLAANSSAVQPACRTEIAAAVKLQMTRYRMGMPLTSVCDGDVMTLCNVDMLTATFLEKGYVQACLVKHVSRLHPPCFSLISMFDDKQFEHAAEVEQHWQGGMRDEQLQKVAAEVRRELEPHLMEHVTHKVTSEVLQRHELLSPRIDALLNSVAILLVLVLVAAGVSAFFYRKRRGTFVIKNASQ